MQNQPLEHPEKIPAPVGQGGEVRVLAHNSRQHRLSICPPKCSARVSTGGSRTARR